MYKQTLIKPKICDLLAGFLMLHRHSTATYFHILPTNFCNIIIYIYNFCNNFSETKTINLPPF